MSAITLVLGGIGAVVGAALGGFDTAILGLAVGAAWGQVVDIGDRLRSVDGQLRYLERRLDALSTPAPPSESRVASRPAPSVAVAHPPVVAPPRAEAPPAPPAHASAPEPPEPVFTERRAGEGNPLPDLPPEPPAARPSPLADVVSWFTTGNLLARVGIVVLFFGVAFLVRFAAERGLLPIEYRLMGAAAGAVVLLGIGWRLRQSRPGYAMTLQGGAVGILYLTIFAAFRLYDLLPPVLTFALLLLVVVLSGILAVAQDAMALAVLGTGGGFMAPLLASTGSGSHVGLFTYYLLLNTGIVGLAWFRSWRLLNWLGFVFTFGIGLLWGSQYYQPRFFATTEPFLAAFFVFYVVVAVLFAHRQPPRLRGYIDGSLIFGTPAVAFAMQSALVRDMEFGRAYSAVALSAVYLLLARAIWRRDSALRPLAEAFLALGVVFLTLAVPFAFDGHGTAAAWALEGAGLVWVGVRQRRVLARVSGTALQAASGLAFALSLSTTLSLSTISRELPVLNSAFLGCVAIALGSIASARQYRNAREGIERWEAPFEWALLVWGLAWWAATVWQEVDRFVAPSPQIAAIGLAVAASSVAMAAVGRRSRWPAMIQSTLVTLPLLMILAAASVAAQYSDGPLAHLGWASWPASLAAGYFLLRRFEDVWPDPVARTWHVLTTWMVVFLLAWTAGAAMSQAMPESSAWAAATWVAVAAVAVLVLMGGDGLRSWPLTRADPGRATLVPLAPVLFVALWIAWACGQSGDASPLPYVPLVNPIELAQAFGLLAIHTWWTRQPSRNAPFGIARAAGVTAVGALAFVALNAVVARITHTVLGIPYDLDALADSEAFQSGVSVLWGLTALSLMTAAGRRAARDMWLVGAGLLGVLVLKLFSVDLGNLDGVARIVSFLVTGALILVIGYLSPIPPKSEKDAS